MWWAPIVSGLFGLLGALIGGGIVVYVNAKNRAHQLEDKSRERQHVLSDKHQENLRCAYAELIAAMLRYRDSCDQYCVRSKNRREDIDQAYEDVVRSGGSAADGEKAMIAMASEPIASAKSRQLMEQMLACGVALEEKISSVLLLESDVHFSSKVEAIDRMTPYFPSGDEVKQERFETEMSASFAKLAELRQELRGHFAPKVATSELGGSATKLLTR